MSNPPISPEQMLERSAKFIHNFGASREQVIQHLNITSPPIQSFMNVYTPTERRAIKAFLLRRYTIRGDHPLQMATLATLEDGLGSLLISQMEPQPAMVDASLQDAKDVDGLAHTVNMLGLCLMALTTSVDTFIEAMAGSMAGYLDADGIFIVDPQRKPQILAELNQIVADRFTPTTPLITLGIGGAQ
jgi:hypothetical protein